MARTLAGPLLLLAASPSLAGGLEVDESSGKVIYDYRFELPPARGRYQPTIGLRFESRTMPGSYSYAFGPRCGYYGAGAGNNWSVIAPRLLPDQGPSGGQPSLQTRDGVQQFVALAGGARAEFERGYLALNGSLATDAAGSTWSFQPAATSGVLGGNEALPPGTQLLASVVDLEGNGADYQYDAWNRLTGITTAAYSVELQYGVPPPAPNPTSVNVLLDVRVKVTADPALGTVTLRRYHLSYETHANDANLTALTEFGGENGPEQRITRFEQYATVPGDGCLRAVTMPLGARFEVTYASSMTFGDTPDWEYPVATAVAVSGPAMVSSTTSYWYGSPARPAAEQRGFAESWAQDGASGIVRHTWWEVASRAYVGSAAQIELGKPLAAGTATQPPTYAWTQRQRYVHGARSLADGTCTPAQQLANGVFQAGEVAATSLPVTLFTQIEEHHSYNAGLDLGSWRSVACGDVDGSGNVTKATVDPDLAIPGDEFLEVATYQEPQCRDCVSQSWRRTPPATGRPSVDLEAYSYTYSASGRLTSVAAKVAATDAGYTPIASWSYYPNGNLASRTERGTTWSYAYDSYGVRVVSERVSNGVTDVVTDTSYDAYGRPGCVEGPYYATTAANVPPSQRPKRCFSYDALGRPGVVARDPVVGSSATGALGAFEYADATSTTPASVSSHVFAVPLSFTYPAIPATSDVRKRIAYLDGLGREVQVRERLGGTVSSDAGASIVQYLGGWRVAKAVLFDGAGRVSASVHPYTSASGAFADLRTASLLGSGGDAMSGPVLATLNAYDAEGRPTCSAVRAISSAVPSAGGWSCTQSDADDASYSRPTRFSYASYADPSGKRYAVSRVISPEAPSGLGRTSYRDAAGLHRFSEDGETNRTTNLFDLLGRVTATVRAGPSGTGKAIATAFGRDMLGRVTSVSSPNTGHRTLEYDGASPLPARVTLPTGDQLRFTYDRGRIATVSICRAPVDAAGSSCAREATYQYDLPYGNDARYGYTAGQLTAAWNASTTIALGYDRNGATARRDQWLPGVTHPVPGYSSAFEATAVATADGRPTTSLMGAPGFGQLPVTIGYDSAGRPVRVSNAGGGTAYWEARNRPDNTGAYDAVGQIAALNMDDGRLVQSWSYGSRHGLLTGQSALLGGGAGPALYQVSQHTYQGTNLAGYADAVTGRVHGFVYGPAGRLARATRSAGAAPAMATDYGYSGTDLATSGAGPEAPTSVGALAVAYDPLGRVAAVGGSAETFGYDLLNRMTSVTRQSGASEALAYDPFGQLVYRKTGTAVTLYAGAGATVSGTVTASCAAPSASCPVTVAWVDVHLSAGGQRVATARLGGSGRRLFLVRDRLGSVVATSVGGGVAGASYRYGDYGSLEGLANESGENASELGYTGGVRLSGGLVLLGARVYHPGLRTFLQPDPLQPQGYAYTGGDPVNWVDPTGMKSVEAPPTQCRGSYNCTVVVLNPNVTSTPTDDGTSGITINSRGEVTILYPRGTMPPSGIISPDGTASFQWPDGNVDSMWMPEWVGGRQFGAEFRRSFWGSIGPTSEAMGTGLGRAGKVAIGGVTSGAVARSLRLTATPLRALWLTAAEIAAPAATSEAFLTFVWTDAAAAGAANFLLSGTAFWGGAVFASAFVAAADATYATSVDSIFLVLSRGRY